MGVYYDGRFANKELSAEEADKLFLKAKDDTEKAEQLKQQEKKMAKKEDPKWIEHSGMKKGALHKELGVPEGKKIPEKKLKKAENSKNPKEKKRAEFAMELKGFHPGGSAYSK